VSFLRILQLTIYCQHSSAWCRTNLDSYWADERREHANVRWNYQL